MLIAEDAVGDRNIPGADAEDLVKVDYPLPWEACSCFEC